MVLDINRVLNTSITFEAKEKKMKKLMKKIENIYAAVAFAEAGEHETAREIMREDDRPQKRERTSERPRKQLRAPGMDR